MSETAPNGRAADGGPTADPAEIAKFDRLASEWWNPDGAFRTLHAINRPRVAYIAERAALDGARVLDVGCGGGLLSEALAARGADVLGIDLAADAIAAAAAHAAETGCSVAYRCASVEEIAAASPETFDVVACLEMLEHVPAPERVVAACARAAKPGAWLFFSTINRNVRSFATAIVAAEYVLGLLPRGTHEYAKLIKPSELARACRAAGLELDDVSGLRFNPLTHDCTVGGGVDVNYIACARKPPSR